MLKFNEVLEKYGKTIRVDHRTLDAQKQEAEKNGDIFLSKVNSRLAEEYIEYKNKNSIPAVLLSLIYRKHEQGINSAEKFQQSYYLTKTKIELEHRKEELNNWKNKLEDESKRLENLCSSDDQNKNSNYRRFHSS